MPSGTLSGPVQLYSELNVEKEPFSQEHRCEGEMHMPASGSPSLGASLAHC